MSMQVFIVDDLPPEDVAMLQALYSRSPESVMKHLAKIREGRGSTKFMEKFYSGYGHKSIGDCGATAIFLEGGSMLFAKAIQDWPLYSGQEVSSRYIDMRKREIMDPVGTEQSARILQRLMGFYSKSQGDLAVHLCNKYPIKDGEEEIVYAKAINARVFDVMRGFLPAGITTQLSWFTNLRQAHDHLALLVHHPLEEVSNTAKALLTQLKEKYPGSFTQKIYPEQEAYRKMLMEKHNYYLGEGGELAPNFQATTNILPQSIAQCAEVFETLPQKTEILPWFEELGSFTFQFPLDFGSFRDIQRHRNGVCRMPLLGVDLGFHEWYLNELPEAMKASEQAARSAAAGQVSLFGGFAEAPLAQVELPACDEWPLEQLLAGERETLGHYLSGHPVDPWRAELAELVNLNLSEVEATWSQRKDRRNEASMILAGLVGNVRKRGDAMAFAQIDDGHGHIELAFFREACAGFGHLLSRDRILIVEGQVVADRVSGELSMRVKQAWDFKSIIDSRGRLLAVRADLRGRGHVEQLLALLSEYRPGATPLRLEITRPGTVGSLEFSGRSGIRPASDLLSRLRHLPFVHDVRLSLHKPWLAG